MTTRSVFISRKLTTGSKFESILRQNGIEKVEGKPLVDLTPIPFEEVPAADWIFFASQHAVIFFFNGLKNNSLPVPAVRWAALGPATGSALAPFISAPDFTGNGHPTQTAAAFGVRAAGATVLFPAALHTRQSVPDALGNRINAVLWPVYQNHPVEHVPLQDAEVLVFTSPMNAATYFKAHPLLPFQRVVAIGPTTFSTLRDLGIACTVAEKPDETHLALRVLSPNP